MQWQTSRKKKKSGFGDLYLFISVLYIRSAVLCITLRDLSCNVNGVGVCGYLQCGVITLRGLSGI